MAAPPQAQAKGLPDLQTHQLEQAAPGSEITGGGYRLNMIGHQNWVYPQFIWDDGHLQEMAPSAKRRRCMDCMPAVARKSAASERRAA